MESSKFGSEQKRMQEATSQLEQATVLLSEYRLRIIARALGVFGDESEAKQWLNEPKQALQGETPLQALDNELGIEQVDIMLGRIEHGIFA